MIELSQRQQQIIDESIRLISEKGIQELTIKNISLRIGISEPAIYRHFASKFDIILGILDHFQTMTETFFSRLADDSSELQKIEQIFFIRLKTFSQNTALAGVIFSEELFRNDQRLSLKVKEIMQLHQFKLAELIKKAQHKKEINDAINPQHLAMMILGPLRLLVTRWRMENYSFELVQEGRKLWNTIELLVQPR